MKVLLIKDVIKKIEILKKDNKVVVQCHGCFDLMHPGHIKYLQSSKRMGDVLIVSVTPDIYVDKGPDRPVFNQNLRAESLSALECVDFVCINKWKTAEKLIRLFKPDIYVKGQEFEKLKDKTGKLQKEYKVIKEINSKICFTHEIVYSSSKLLNKYFLNI